VPISHPCVISHFHQHLLCKGLFHRKSKCLNFIIQSSLKNEKTLIDYEQYDTILNEGKRLSEPSITYKKLYRNETEPIVKSLDEYGPGQTFEDYSYKKIYPFYGKKVDEIVKTLNLNLQCKGFELLCKFD
jgi:hypothetical protein